jgi:hypothetical protein
VLGIFRARAGRYLSRELVPDGRGSGLELVISEASGGYGVSAVVSRYRSGDRWPGECLELSLIGADEDCAVTLLRSTAAHSAAGVVGGRLGLRVHVVDAVRCAQIVFGHGDIEGDGFSEEVVFEFEYDGRVTYVHAWGVPGDPYAVRVRHDWWPARRPASRDL